MLSLGESAYAGSFFFEHLSGNPDEACAIIPSRQTRQARGPQNRGQNRCVCIPAHIAGKGNYFALGSFIAGLKPIIKKSS
jgi:hypothetical protein